MPVLNVDIAETIEITSNGQHDVAKYTTADVNVPKVINPLPITPSTSAQTFTATGGVDGYSPVSVSAVTAAIDANITAGNIKKDVQILGVTGTYEGGGGGGALTLQYGNSSGTLTKPSSVMDLTGITTIPDKGMMYLYAFDDNITGVIDYSNITNVGEESFKGTFLNCTAITGVDFSGVTTINGYSPFGECFQSCWSLDNVDFSGLTTIGSDSGDCFFCAFQDCRFRNGGVDFSSLQSIATTGAFESAFSGSGLTSVSFPSLQSIAEYCFSGAFSSCSRLTSVSFPALLSNFFGESYAGQFADMLVDDENVTVHFPSNLQAVIGNEQDVLDGFSGTNTTVLFDLPATE